MQTLSAREIVQVWEWGQDKHPIDRALCLLALAEPELTIEQIASLTVGQRNRRLLSLREKMLGATLHGLANCPKCRSALEFSVAVGALLQPEPDTSEYNVGIEGFDITFHLPNSWDLAKLVGCEDVKAARQLLIDSCLTHLEYDNREITATELSDSVMAHIISEIIDQDPQAEMRFHLTCADCDYSWSALFDIVSFLWIELSAFAKRLLMDVHTLAYTYGWDEADLLSMSAIRRQFYLELHNDE